MPISELVQGKSLTELLYVLLVQTGVGWAFIGAALAFSLSGLGSALGIRISCSQAAGVLSEKPELFGRLLVIMALPGTQGFYGFIVMVMMALRSGLIAGKVAVGPWQGLGLLAVGFGVGLVEWRSAIYQGETSAAATSLVAKRPEEAGRAILLPALVETYAVLSLLAGILLTLWLTAPGLSLPTALGTGQ